jgi:hypothetical protein
VVVRKKTSKGGGIGSGVSGYIKGNDTEHNPATFSFLVPRESAPHLPKFL